LRGQRSVQSVGDFNVEGGLRNLKGEQAVKKKRGGEGVFLMCDNISAIPLTKGEKGAKMKRGKDGKNDR